jgi:hypothetical protein
MRGTRVFVFWTMGFKSLEADGGMDFAVEEERRMEAHLHSPW